MELSWSWEKSSLDSIPNSDGGVNKWHSHVANFWRIFLGVEQNFKNSTVNVLNGLLGWWSHVQREEVSLESWWNIIPTTTWMVHGAEELETLDSLLITSLILG